MAEDVPASIFYHLVCALTSTWTTSARSLSRGFDVAYLDIDDLIWL